MNAKVLFVAPSAYPLGGVQTWLDYVIPGVEQYGFQSTLALTSGQFHDVNEYLSVHPCAAVEIVEAKTGTKQGRIRALEKTIVSVNPDIILVVNIHDVYQAVNNLRKRHQTHARVVSTLHGIHSGLISDIALYSNIIDGVVTTNRLTQKLVREKTNIPHPRCYYAPYGVELSNEIQRPPHDFTLAYVGRLEEDQKCVNDLLAIFTRALQLFPQLKILVAGDGPQLNVFLEWQQRTQASSNITYLGVLTPQQLEQQVYAQADVLLLTSSWETGPIVAWEAMAHSVSVVSSRYIGHHEEGSLQHEHNCLMFDVSDIDGAVGQIKQASQLSIREHLNSNAKALIESKYSIDSSIRSWADCLTQILENQALEYDDETVRYKDSSRLNTLLESIFGQRGLNVAEALRRFCAYRFEHSSAGSEWPHCISPSESGLKSLSEFVK